MSAYAYRLAQLREMLDARMDPATGKARKGFTKNVAALQAEIRRLEQTAPAATSTESA